jgi:bifunctional non-homologous end joining protein LigD
VASFDRIRYGRHDASVFLYAFDLIELSGDDLRRDPLQVRKATLASVLAKAGPGIRFNEHIEGATARQSSRMPAGWASKALSRSAGARPTARGRSPDWLKMKNPACAAVKREAEEDWGR